MKTGILKWDVFIQAFLLVINTAVLAGFIYEAANPKPEGGLFFILLLWLETIIGVYQLISNGLHLLLNHRSIGFVFWRLLITGVVIIYWTVLTLTQPTIFLLVVHQVLMYAYAYLCYRELEFLERREFFILKNNYL